MLCSSVVSKLCSSLNKLVLPSSKHLVNSSRVTSCLYSLPCCQSTQQRNYSIGEYDKLWQAVNSGKGKRGGRKKTTLKEKDGDFLNFGKEKVTFPGLNAPISQAAGERQARFEKNEEGKPFRRKWDATQRGWSGTSWPGRHAGAPETPNKEPIDGFDSIVIEVKKVSITRGNGRRKRTSAIVVVGNGNGAIGWAIGKGSFASAAIRKARNKAVNYLHYVPIHEDKTVYHNLHTQVKSTKVIFERKVKGYGMRCQRTIRAICQLAGIENIRCKIVGRTTPLTVVKATFQGLTMQETHQELAERTGKNVVEMRAENGYRPIVLCAPSQQAVQRRIETEANMTEDITQHFDPYKGVHRPKNVNIHS